MPRDYKNVGGKRTGKPAIGVAGFLAFLSGLSIGLLVAFLVYLYFHGPYGEPAGSTPSAAVAQTPAANSGAGAGTESAPPRPTFDFYKILPSREVNVSEWVAEDQPAAPGSAAVAAAPAAEPGGLYILQVGSFKTAEAADQIKARLALLGITADVQRVVINGQDAILRVRIGPYRDPEKFEEMRQRLLDNGIDFMVLKLKMEGPQSGAG